ncbi:RmlC-like cupin domain-containing protein [Xylariaceae sp. FL0594]|nr:RmlC-like cupin domain-containing protein [Xylariaceae sp. FL0594]
MIMPKKLATAYVAFATLLAPLVHAKCVCAGQYDLKYTAQQVIDELKLEPNPEGGWYAETFRDPANLTTTTTTSEGNRSISTAIYYLLEGPGVASRWHRILDAVEIWHWYAGAPMVLRMSGDDGTPTRSHRLGPDVLLGGDGERPQVVIPKGTWQQAVSCGNWTLVGTTVAPGFVPEGTVLAPPGWEPNTGSYQHI